EVMPNERLRLTIDRGVMSDDRGNEFDADAHAVERRRERSAQIVRGEVVDRQALASLVERLPDVGRGQRRSGFRGEDRTGFRQAALHDLASNSDERRNSFAAV